MIRIIFLYLIIGFSFFNNINAQDEAYICRYLFTSSNEITQLSTNAISIAVDAVWVASGITGVITTTGTLTQNPSNPDVWTYSANPTDRFILNFSDGTSIVFTFYSINGYTGGDADDFKNSHQMDFNTFVQNSINLRINSNTYPQNGKTYWQRTITGTAQFDLQGMNVNILHTGNISYDIGNGFAFYSYTEQATGTSNTGSLSINVNEGYWRFIGNNSNLSTFVMNTEITNNSSGNFGSTTYQYQNARVFWAAASVIYGGYYNMVVDPSNWVAQGTMQKNGQTYGTVQFNGPVINGTYGPDLVLHLNNGTDIFLHTLIDFPTSIIDNDESDISEFEIMQNYPNPFNSTTKIKWQLNKSGYVLLKVYDVLGNEIETLVNKEMPAGLHEVNFDASALSSGIFFYTITAGDRNITKKMILMR